MLWFVAASFLAVSGNISYPQQKEDIYLETSHSSEIIQRVKDSWKNREWKDVAGVLSNALRDYPREMVKIEDNEKLQTEVWTSVGEYALNVISQLSKKSDSREIIDVYRNMYDSKASSKYERALREKDVKLWEECINEYFFATGMDDAMNRLANIYFEEGKTSNAIFHWYRLLKYYPDIKIDKSLVVAKMALIYQFTKDEMGLEFLRRYVNTENVSGNVNVAGKDVDIKKFVNEMNITNIQQDLAPLTSQAAPHTINVGSKLWQEPVFQMVSPMDTLIFFPSAAKIGDRNYLILHNGLEIIAFDPMKDSGAGSSKTSRVYWKYPEKVQKVGNPPSIMPSVFSCTIDENILLVNLFSPKRGAVMINSANWEAPNSIMAYNITKGMEIWNTGQNNDLDVEDKNFVICSSPIVLGDKLYVGAVLSSNEPEIYILCLDKYRGKLLWKSPVCAILRGQYTSQVRPVLLTESGGILYIQTNLGVILAMNSINGNIMWLYKYKTGKIIKTANYPVISKGVLFALPQDTTKLFAFDRNTGDILHIFEDSDYQNIVGILDCEGTDFLIVSGVQNLHCIRGGDDYKEYLAPIRANKVFRGAILENTIFIPTDGDLKKFTMKISNGGTCLVTLEDSLSWKKEEIGNVLIIGDNIYSCSPSQVSAYKGKTNTPK